MRFYLLIFLLSLSIGCGLEQDPFAKYGEGIKNAAPPKEKVKRPPLPADALILEVPGTMMFKEGNEDSYQIQSRVTVEAKSIEITVEGLPKDALFDEVTGKISWEPDRKHNDGEPIVSFPVTFKLSASVPTVISIERTVLFVVLKRK